MKKKLLLSMSIAFLLLLFLPVTAFADSSWGWITGNPLPMLPWAIVGTLVIEIFIICFFNGIRFKKIIKPAAIIVLENLAAFLTPYIFVGLVPGLFEENSNFLLELRIGRISIRSI